MLLCSPRLVLGLTVLTVVPVLSAPLLPKPNAGLNLERYLLDDTDFLAVVNVKQIVASPMVVKHFKKPLVLLRRGKKSGLF